MKHTSFTFLGFTFGADKVLDMVSEFEVDCSQLHNDSTSVMLTGACKHAAGRQAHGCSRSRPFQGLSPRLEAAGLPPHRRRLRAVPVACRTANGSVEDSTTHTEMGRIRRPLCTFEVPLRGRQHGRHQGQYAHIVQNQGRFVSVLPPRAKRTASTRRWLVWVRSSAKVERDADSRWARIDALDASTRPLPPKTRMKSLVFVKATAAEAVESAGRHSGSPSLSRRSPRSGLGANTRYRRIETTKEHRVRFGVREDVVRCCHRHLLGRLLAAHHLRPHARAPSYWSLTVTNRTSSAATTC